MRSPYRYHGPCTSLLLPNRPHLILLLLLCHLLEPSAAKFKPQSEGNPKTSAVAFDVSVSVDGSRAQHHVGDDFACVTMDWWPANKCDYGVCPWDGAGVLNVNLHSERLRNALAALQPITLRIGGTQADNITYAVGSDRNVPCPDFSPALPQNSSHFNGGCLNESRLLEINEFCDGCRLVFGINLMNGRDRKFVKYDQPCPGSWNSSNAVALLEFAKKNNITFYGVELGNEIECLSPSEYAADIKTLKKLVESIFTTGNLAPKIIVTDQLHWEPEFFSTLIPMLDGAADIITWHDYPLGPGYGNPNLDSHIMNASFHDKFITTASSAFDLVHNLTSGRTQVWMGETGGCYNSGHNMTSNTFMNAFWYLESMAGFAAAGHSGFCRQTFIGGNYELVDKESLIPNPDFYGLLLFNRLMGSKVLNVKSSNKDSVRAWAHCTKTGSSKVASVTFLLLNYDHESVKLDFEHVTEVTQMDLYIITSDLKNRTVMLNDQEIIIENDGKIPPLNPVTSSELPLSLPGYSYAFVIIPAKQIKASVCIDS